MHGSFIYIHVCIHVCIRLPGRLVPGGGQEGPLGLAARVHRIHVHRVALQHAPQLVLAAAAVLTHPQH